MAYLDTARLVHRPKPAVWRKAAPEARSPGRGSGLPAPLQREIDRRLHQSQEMLVVGLIGAGTIIAVALAVLIRL